MADKIGKSVGFLHYAAHRIPKGILYSLLSYLPPVFKMRLAVYDIHEEADYVLT
jgi:hypothetical protein